VEVIVGKMAGFCPGVKNAVDKTREKLEAENRQIFCLGELVHNKQVVEELEEMNMITVENISEVPNGEKVIFRAHGVTKEVYEECKKRNIEYTDLTCIKVLEIHKNIEKVNENKLIVLVGDKNHPETIGSKSFGGNRIIVMQTLEDIVEIERIFKKSNFENIEVFCQTTFSVEKFNEFLEELKKVDENLIINNTICHATRIRQEETEKLSKDVEYMIIVGGKNSSNTKKLADISRKNCNKVEHIETVDELKLENFKEINKVGIMAGASTPQKSIEDVRKVLENI